MNLSTRLTVSCLLLLLGLAPLAARADQAYMPPRGTIFRAAYDGNVQQIQQILRTNKRAVKKKDPVRNHDALHYAAQQGHPEAVRLLLKRGADPNVRDDEGRTALMSTIGSKGGLQVATLLLGAGANVNAQENRQKTTALHFALLNKKPDLALVKLLVSKGANVNAVCNFFGTPLAMAKERGHRAAEALLLARGARSGS